MVIQRTASQKKCQNNELWNKPGNHVYFCYCQQIPPPKDCIVILVLVFLGKHELGFSPSLSTFHLLYSVVPTKDKYVVSFLKKAQ